MKFYAYRGTALLGNEPCGGDGKLLFKLKTDIGALRRCFKAFGLEPFRLYAYGNFYDKTTFREVL